MTEPCKPGSTLQMLIDRYEFLDRLKQLLRKRFDIESNYLDQLVDLQEQMDNLQYNAEPQSPLPFFERSSGQTPTPRQKFDPAMLLLLSPLLTPLNEEIRRRKTTNRTLRAFLDNFPSVAYPNDSSLGTVTPKKKYENLVTSYKAYQESYDIIKTQESISKLQEWYEKPRRPVPVTELSQEELVSYRFPKIDQDYRNKVLDHCEMALSVRVWHQDTIPKHLEACQADIERVKSLIGEIVKDYGSLNTDLARAFSAAQMEIDKVSSVKLVSPIHAMKEEEDRHKSFQDVRYRNFCTGDEDHRPVFCTKRARQIAFRMLEKASRHQAPKTRLPPMPPLSTLFAFETDELAVARIEYGVMPEGSLAIQFLILVFLSRPPSFEVQYDNQAKRSSDFQKNVSVQPSYTSSLELVRWTQYLLAWERLNIASTLLTHSHGAADALGTWVRNSTGQCDSESLKEAWARYDPDETGYVEHHKVASFLASLRGIWDVRINPEPRTVASIQKACRLAGSGQINHRLLMEHLTKLGYHDTVHRRNAYNILYWEIKILCQLSEARVVHVAQNQAGEPQKRRDKQRRKGFGISRGFSQFKESTGPTVTKKFFVDHGISFQDMLILLLRYKDLATADGNVARALREHVAMDKIQSFCQMVRLRKQFLAHMARKRTEQVEVITSDETTST